MGGEAYSDNQQASIPPRFQHRMGLFGTNSYVPNEALKLRVSGLLAVVIQ